MELYNWHYFQEIIVVIAAFNALQIQPMLSQSCVALEEEELDPICHQAPANVVLLWFFLSMVIFLVLSCLFVMVFILFIKESKVKWKPSTNVTTEFKEHDKHIFIVWSMNQNDKFSLTSSNIHTVEHCCWLASSHRSCPKEKGTPKGIAIYQCNKCK